MTMAFTETAYSEKNRVKEIVRRKPHALVLPAWPVLLAGAGFLVWRVLLFCRLSLSLVAWPWQFDYDEGINLNSTLQLAQGHNIYSHNGPGAFISAPYTPLFNLLNVPLVWLVGPSFAGGRALSLACTIGIALLIAYIVWKVCGLWAAGILGGMLWLSLSPVIVWAAIYKQDMLALFLGLAGLAWALVHKPGRGVYVAALFFALAFYSKQSALSAALATSIWLFVGSRAKGLRFILALGALILLPTLVANAALHGELWEHLVGNNALPWSRMRFWNTLQRAWGENWPLLLWSSVSAACVLVAGVHTLVFRRRVYRWRQPSALSGGAFPKPSFIEAAPWRKSRPDRAAPIRPARIVRLWQQRGPACSVKPYLLVAIYFLMGGASTLVQIGSEGANYNHLLDLLLPSCLLGALTVGWLARCVGPLRWRPRLLRYSDGVVTRYLGPAGLALAGLLLVAQLGSFRDPRTWFYSPWPNRASDTALRRVDTLIANTQGAIYSEDAYLLLRNKHPVVYDDPSTFVPLTLLGRWDDSYFLQSLCQGRFALIILSHESKRWTPTERVAFQANYRLVFTDVVDVYEPRVAFAKHRLSEVPRGAASGFRLWALAPFKIGTDQGHAAGAAGAEIGAGPVSWGNAVCLRSKTRDK